MRFRRFLNGLRAMVQRGRGPAVPRRPARPLSFEVLEDRTVPSGLQPQAPFVSGFDPQPYGFPTPGATGGFTPAQIRHAYGIDQILFGSIVGDGSGQT